MLKWSDHNTVPIQPILHKYTQLGQLHNFTKTYVNSCQYTEQNKMHKDAQNVKINKT